MNNVAELCFAIDALDGAAIAAIVRERDLGFRPTKLNTNRWSARYGSKALDRLATTDRLTHAELSDPGHVHDFGAIRLDGFMQHLHWTPENPAVLRPGIEAITRRPGFIAARVFWAWLDLAALEP